MSAITTALCLPAPDADALVQGQTVVAMSNTFRNPPHFLLCPVQAGSENYTQSADCYRQIFVDRSINSRGTADADIDTITAHAWGKFEACRVYNSSSDFDALSKLTVWTDSYLQKIVQARHKIFLIFLNVHRFDHPVQLTASRSLKTNIGSYFKLPQALSSQQSTPVLDEQTFATRQKQLFDLSPPSHPELEGLWGAIAALPDLTPQSAALDQDLRYLLGWAQGSIQAVDSDLSWIQQIAETGNSSDGYAFEKLVRKSLIKLGFSNSSNDSKASLDPEATGGAGGVDVYCDAPYSLVGECKASRHESVPNDVTAQLIHLGITHLGQTQFAQSVKVVFAAGRLTGPANQAAIQNHMNVLRPDTLQRLTELKSLYPGAIDLLKLKPCLQEEPHGSEADTKVNQFVDRAWQELKLRSNLVQLIKTYLRNTGFESVETNVIFGAYMASVDSAALRLGMDEIHEILIELSSPLAGYLGRVKDAAGSDRFYFLKDLIIQPN